VLKTQEQLYLFSYSKKKFVTKFVAIYIYIYTYTYLFDILSSNAWHSAETHDDMFANSCGSCRLVP